MNTTEEGYIKFQCNWTESLPLISQDLFEEVNSSRSRMVAQGLIGSFDNGIGFGNISIRNTKDKSQFFITGSATGSVEAGVPSIYALVERWDISSNALWCTGAVKASSESMSHAAIYELLPDVNCVIHIHCMKLWEKGVKTLPCTPVNAQYGTPEIAMAISNLIKSEDCLNSGIFAMKGHEEGIIMYGRTPEEAEYQLIKAF